MKILITGGLGYIGSHTAVEFSDDYEILIADNLINSDISVLDSLNQITKSNIIFEKVDLTDMISVNKLFDKHSDIKNVIHFAALKSVEESLKYPLKYYHNNITSLVNILSEIKKRKMEINFVFSSSCAVYGEPKSLPIDENEKIKEALSPYANTKQICEKILTDFSKICENFNALSLRYFNPIGAHKSLKIGEFPIGKAQNLVPIITQSVAGIRNELIVYGDDYQTHDGSCIRDFIHVSDLANAHICALKYLEKNNNIKNEFFNIGTGIGTSVFSLIKSFEKVTGHKVNFKIGARRPGDAMAAYSDNSKAIRVLNWKPRLGLDKALLSAWNWEKMKRINN